MGWFFGVCTAVPTVSYNRQDIVIDWHMIPIVPIAFAVLAFLAWRYDASERRAYEATLSKAEKRQFRALRRVHPAKWRAAIALKQAETKSAGQQAETGRKTPA